MVATAARKARREAAALAAAGGAPAAAAPSPAAATPAARALTTSATRSAAISSSSSLAPRKTIVKGTGSKSQGTYTPPAILRAVANAARNKESKGGGNGGGGDRTGGAAAAKADWDCARCGKSNFAKRRACFKCDAPRPGRTFTAAGVKGWEKRQAKRAAKQQAAGGGGGGGETRDDDDDAAAAAARDARPKKPKKTKLSDDGDEDEDEDKRRNARPKRKSVKASDRGKAPKKLRDPTAPLVYLEAWMGRGELDASTGKPANGWKLDKNIQNWLLHNVFDEGEVDDDVFDITVMYAGGLRGGPATRLRDAAREKNFGKGVVAERARKILRALEKSASEVAE